MEPNNDLINALSKIPLLTEAAEKILTGNEEYKKLLAELLKKQLSANVPPEEIEKIVAEVVAQVTKAITKTRCAPPDVTELSRLIAEQVVGYLKDCIASAVEPGVEAAIKRHPITVASPMEYARYIEPKLKRGAVFMAIVASVAVLFSLGYYLYESHSKANVGRQYMEIILSDYVTSEEFEMLRKDIFTVSALPNVYDRTPKLVKQRMKRNKEILSQRKAEAKANDGKFSTNVTLER